MKILFRLSLVLICSLFLIASDDMNNVVNHGKPYIEIYDENGKLIDKSY